jgi:UDP-sulfoquinovose synthase
LKVDIQHVENPRIEAEEHYYHPEHTGLIELGLKPHYLTDETLVQMMQFVLKQANRIRTEQIYRKIKWA